MKTLLNKLFFVSVIMAFFGNLSHAQATALECLNNPMNPPVQATWCDADPTRYVGNFLCLAEPSNQENIFGNGVCILGKFKNSSDLQRLVDFSVSYDFVSNPLFSGLFAPNVETLQSSNGEFRTTFPLDQFGTYQISVQATFFDSQGDFQTIEVPTRTIQKSSLPDRTVNRVRLGHSVACAAGTTDPNCLNINGDRDGDGICDGPTAILGVCTAGPDTTDDSNSNLLRPRVIQIMPSSSGGGGSTASIKANMIQLCVASHNSGMTEEDMATIMATNTITHTQNTIRQGAEGSVANPDGHIEVKGKLSTDDPIFCSGGSVLEIPLGNGTNTIEISVSNPSSGVAGQPETIQVLPFNVDLKGPDLCVQYLNDAGVPIPNVDGRVLLPSEAGNHGVMVDVTLGKCGPNVVPEVLAAQAPQGCSETPPVCGSSPVCVQRNNEKVNGADSFVTMCARRENGVTHYNARLAAPQFPMNTVKVKAIDDLGNITYETHAFGFGNVRSIFTPVSAGQIAKSSSGLRTGMSSSSLRAEEVSQDRWEVNLQNAMVPKGLGGFIPASYIYGDFKTTIEKVVNTPKFKNDILLKMLDPQVPVGEELHCTLTHPDRIRTFKFFSPQIGRIEIPSLFLLDNDTIWVQLKINGLHGDAEIFTMQFYDDGSGIGHPDEVDSVPGTIISDELTHLHVLPAKITMRELTLNVAMHLHKVDGKTSIDVSNVPTRNLIDPFGDNGPGGPLVGLDCARTESLLHINGRSLPLVRHDCENIQSGTSFDSQGLNPTLYNQNIDQILVATLNDMFRCNIPRRIEAKLNEFSSKKLMGLSLDLFGTKANFDFFSPLSTADIHMDRSGVSFAGDGLLLTAGSSATPRDAIDFLNNDPSIAPYRNSKFGALYQAETSSVDPHLLPDPVEALFSSSVVEGDNHFNLALKEETINSLVHASTLVLSQILDLGGNAYQPTDIDTLRVREFGLGIQDRGDSQPCPDKNGHNFDGSHDFRCFQFHLDAEELIGTDLLNYVDFDRDGSPSSVQDKKTPLLLRTGMNPFLAPTVRLVSVTPIGAWNNGNGGPTRPLALRAELEIGLGGAPMAVFEEQVQDLSGSIVRARVDPATSKPLIKSWCDRAAGMNSSVCSAPTPANLPIAVFTTAGKVSVTLMFSLNRDGLIDVVGGVSSLRGQLDSNKTYLNVSVLENNTIIPDTKLIEKFEPNLQNIIGRYLFATPRSIHLAIPAQVPLNDFCAHTDFRSELPDFCSCVDHPNATGCESVGFIQNIWDQYKDRLHDFGVDGATLGKPAFDVTNDVNLGNTRYLLVGSDPVFKLAP